MILNMNDARRDILKGPTISQSETGLTYILLSRSALNF